MTKKILAILILALAAPALAVVTTTTTTASYTGNGATTVFTFTFPAQNASDVELYLAGAKQSSGYTVALNANQTTTPGGTVTVSPAPAAGVAVKVQRTVPLTQAVAVGAYSAFPSKTIEKALDKLAMESQQLDRTHADDKAAQAVKDANQDSAIAQGAVGGNDTYIISTGSTTARKIKDRFAVVANVQDFGAKPDGGITDNAPLIEQAVATLLNKRGVLYFPNGASYYGVARPVAIVGDGYAGLTVLGDGPNSWIKLTADPQTTDTISGVGILGVLTFGGSSASMLNGVTVRNLRISSYSETISTLLIKILVFSRVKNVVIEGCEFDTGRYEGLYIASDPIPENITIRNNYFHNIGGFATTGGWGLAAINPGANNVAIEGNLVENVCQFIENNTDYVVVRGNRFRNAVRSDGSPCDGITVRLTNVNAAGDPKKAVISDNVVEYAGAGIRVSSSGSGSAIVAIRGNEVNRAEKGIWVEHDATMKDALIEGNRLTDSRVGGAGSAIRLDTSGTIRNNTVRIVTNQFSTFVDLSYASVGNISVLGNTFIGSPASSGINSGIWQPEVSGNTFSGWTVASPAIFWGSNYPSYTITGNVLTSSAETVISPTNRTTVVTNLGTGPSAGSWKVGDVAYYQTPTAGGLLGLVCTSRGTLGSLTGITGSITTGTKALTVSAISTIGIGSAISIAGVTGTKYVTAISGTNVTVDTNADATVAGAAVQYVAPTFKKFGAIGVQVPSVSADRGDADQTLVVGTDAQTQRWATTLTANRTVTCSTTGAANGDHWHVVRTGLGTFTLDVCGLKTIPSVTAAFVDVSYNGSAWMLTGYGTL